ncbi:hypothetical protein MKW94_025575, partial [Papaver nudicaule]|nr:hypothetical protein [Papaver nudicaule]
MHANETSTVPNKKNPMKKIGSWEKLCNLVGISHHPPKGNGILFGFGSMIGASILVFTVFLFMFPIFSPSFKNPILQGNHLKEFYYKFSQWPFHDVSTTSTSTNATIATPAPVILKNLTQDTQNATSLISSPLSLEPFVKNSTEGFSNSSTAVSVGLPKAEELVIMEDKSTPSNLAGDHNSSSTYHDREQENVDAEYCDANVFDGEWVKIEGRKQYYEGGSCPYVEPSPYNCYMNGRPDNDFLKWHWQWQSQQADARCNNLP